MKFNLLIIMALAIVTGCGPIVIERHPQANTTSPTSAQLQQCRRWMHIHPDLEIEPQGLFIETGLDTSAAFKFIAKTDNPAQLFDPDIIESSEFKLRDSTYGLDEHSVREPWWDATKRKLIGGNFSIPQGNGLNIGFEHNDDDTITVYAFWIET